MIMTRDEIKEALTSDTATLTETIYAFVDMIFEKGCVTNHDLGYALDVDVSDTAEVYVWTVGDIKSTFECNDHEASEVIEGIQNDDLANEELSCSIVRIGEKMGLKRK